MTENEMYAKLREVEQHIKEGHPNTTINGITITFDKWNVKIDMQATYKLKRPTQDLNGQ